ncbi:ABC-type branched-chain amino acid transport system, substrate-binding protein [Blastococcus tunisiensis]|uniref:ABC-type branched-chain amino acid transport system, substrate-binding protein n=2 Tax=Blastococcus tunisiensis TaxID=1798228 RepID=A0A1I2A593_9ACTN|nr:ABC-type branched-chain amino acid transport system, substrate-binding protein [Blastococcus sp. DSM 46838]
MVTRMNGRALAATVAATTLLTACGGGDEDSGGDAGAGGTTYNQAWLVDFSGPYADVYNELQAAREATNEWWNETVGSEIGVQLAGEPYDHRYDAAQVASLWPGILSELEPIMAMGVGGPDVAALQQRLPQDQVPLLMNTAGYGYAWSADQWVFNPRATYAHEATGFVDWFKEDRGLDRPVRVAMISSEAAPAYVDIVDGMEAFAEDFPDMAEVVAVEFADVQPAALNSQVSRIVDAEADVIIIQTNTTQAVVTKQALESLGVEIPIMLSSHNSLQATGAAAGGIEELEGDYESYGFVVPAAQEGTAYDFYQMLVEDYGLEAEWTVPTVQGIAHQLYANRTVEHAVEMVGAENLTGQAMYDALLDVELTAEDLFEFLPPLDWTEEAPFPTSGLTTSIGTIEDGEYARAELDHEIPELEKW